MDMWSDPNLSPFMAATAHWIKAVPKITPDGTDFTLELQADLIGFHRVPGSHTGEHLAQAFIHVLDRLSIADKVSSAIMYIYLPLLSGYVLDWMDHVR